MPIPRNWLKVKRLKLGLKQKDVAEAAGIQRAYYTMIESGVRDPSVDVAKKISDVIGFEWPIFFEECSNDMTLCSGADA
jgi:transcriptional regulator with XRE-family HTH domain